MLTEALEWVTTGKLPLRGRLNRVCRESIPPSSVSACGHASAFPIFQSLQKTLGWLRTLRLGAKLDAAAQKRVRQTLQRESLDILRAVLAGIG